MIRHAQEAFFPDSCVWQSEEAEKLFDHPLETVPLFREFEEQVEARKAQ